MIDDLDKTIEALLKKEIKNGGFDVKFEQPTRDWRARLNRPTINCFLYDVRENNVLREHRWMSVENGRIAGRSSQKRTPYRIDCYYMLSSWATEPQDEHLLLTNMLRALFRFPILPEDRLVGALEAPVFPIQARVAAHDKLTNPAEVWSALDNEMHPAISYIVTLAIDPWKPISGPTVSSRELRLGPWDSPPDMTPPRFPPDADPPLFSLGGTVTQGGEPAANIEVAIRGTGYLAVTEENGRYQLNGLKAGKHTLIAWPSKGKPKQKQISVPKGDYDIAL